MTNVWVYFFDKIGWYQSHVSILLSASSWALYHKNNILLTIFAAKIRTFLISLYILPENEEANVDANGKNDSLFSQQNIASLKQDLTNYILKL